jgi:hypothetical protein
MGVLKVFDQWPQQFEHASQFVFFVVTHHVEKLVHELNSSIIFSLGVNRSQAHRQCALKRVPRRGRGFMGCSKG